MSGGQDYEIGPSPSRCAACWLFSVGIEPTASRVFVAFRHGVKPTTQSTSRLILTMGSIRLLKKLLFLSRRL